MIGWGLEGTVPLPAGERVVPRGVVRPTGQAPSAPNFECELPRGRKAGRLTPLRKVGQRNDDNIVAKSFIRIYWPNEG